MDYEKPKQALEEELKKIQLGFRIKRCVRSNDDITFYYTLSGNQDKMDRFTVFLLGFREVKSFDE